MRNHFVTVAIALIVTIAAILLMDRPSVPGVGSLKPQETAYERVLRTGVLRCGYALWPPSALIKDPNSGEIKGIVPDILADVTHKLGLKLEWTEETGWTSFIEGLRSNRFDAFCAGAWTSAERGRAIGFTSPIFYSTVYPYVRADDHRFDQSLGLLNALSMRVSTMDGEMSDIIARTDFPNAQRVSIPQLGEISSIFMNVASGKADVVINEPSLANDFMAKNPGTIRRLRQTPYQTFPTSAAAVLINEHDLQSMIDSAVVELLNLGSVDRIIDKYEPDRSVFLRVAKPYVIEPSQ